MKRVRAATHPTTTSAITIQTTIHSHYYQTIYYHNSNYYPFHYYQTIYYRNPNYYPFHYQTIYYHNPNYYLLLPTTIPRTSTTAHITLLTT